MVELIGKRFRITCDDVYISSEPTFGRFDKNYKEGCHLFPVIAPTCKLSNILYVSPLVEEGRTDFTTVISTVPPFVLAKRVDWDILKLDLQCSVLNKSWIYVHNPCTKIWVCKGILSPFDTYKLNTDGNDGSLSRTGPYCEIFNSEGGIIDDKDTK